MRLLLTDVLSKDVFFVTTDMFLRSNASQTLHLLDRRHADAINHETDLSGSLVPFSVCINELKWMKQDFFQ